jgi:hypothetical protein
MKLFRRFALLGAALTAAFGVLAVPFASSANAAEYQIGTDPGIVLGVCLTIRAADTKVCIDI